tara:strand:- start:84 stop:698 length:615 start_codon:yes stop_codon:yes gene_type:complete
MSQKAAQFLELFSGELLINSVDPWEKKILEEKKEKLNQLREEMKQLMEEKMNFKPERKHEQLTIIETPAQEIPQQQEIQEQAPQQTQQPEQQQEIQQPSFDNNEGLSKVEDMLHNRSIHGIECPGPGKFILIKRGNRRTPTRVVLDREDINSILDFFSEQSRIPRIGGSFKAIVNNMVITAIDSAYGGPRFIITKTAPQPSRYL